MGLWREVDDFVAPGLPEHIVTLTPCAPVLTDCQTRQLPRHPLAVRLVRITLASGAVEASAHRVGSGALSVCRRFKDLYHRRWPVEEDYKMLKLRVAVENWLGKSPLSIYKTSTPKCSPLPTAILVQQR